MELAIIKTGGKQYLVKEGDILLIEKIIKEPGEKFLFEEVLAVFDSEKDGLIVGKPYLKGFKIEAKVIDQEKGEKIYVVKYKPKVRYHKKTGHRQLYTRVKILKIETAAK